MRAIAEYGRINVQQGRNLDAWALAWHWTFLEMTDLGLAGRKCILQEQAG